MTQNASFLPPNITPPDSPEARVLTFIFSFFMSLLFIVVIGVVCIDFFAELVGVPLISEAEMRQEGYQHAEEEPIEKIKAPFELITPQHQTQLIGPDIVVIYTRRLPNGGVSPPKLLVDGTPQPWKEQLGGNTWFTRLPLPAGLHHVKVEESNADFFVETIDSSLRSSEPWAWNHPHPDTDNVDRCSDCHERSNQSRGLSIVHNQSIGSWKGITSCFECHDEEVHTTLHAFLQPATRQCIRCHTIH